MSNLIRKQRFLIAALACVLVLVLLGAPRASSQTGGQYDLSWTTIDGGGITLATGGDYELGGTIGQEDTGATAGGAYSLNGGFWVPQSATYLPTILR
jgi:hypothetical protein